MMITTEQLRKILDRLEPWHPKATDLRKLPNGKIVRFINWNWKRRRP